MKNTQLRLRLFAAASALALLWAAPSARANVYATNIKLAGSLKTNVVSGAGVPLTITFILNEAATAGTTINILSGATVVRTITIASGQGTLQGLNTVTWDGNNGSGNPVAVGTYSVSITAAATGHTTWSQISTDNTANSAAGLFGMAVNNNPSSPYYGRVFAGNKSGGTGSAPCGIMKLNADCTAADEGNWGTAGFTFANNGYNPWGLRYNSADDRLYFLDFNTQGDLYATDSLVATNQHVLAAANYSSNPYPIVNSGSGWISFEVFGSGNNGYFFLGDNDYGSTASTEGAGVFMWHMVNGVANPSDHTGTQVLRAYPAAGDLTIPSGGLMVDANTNFYVGQERANATDTTPRVLQFQGWNGSTTLTTPTATWKVGGADANFLGNYQLAIDSRTNPTYVAVAVGGVGYGIRVLYATNGAVVTANSGSQTLTNLDNGNHYWGVAWDAVGNLYGCESVGNHVRAFSPPGANTNTTVAYVQVSIIDVGPTITQQPQPASLTTNQSASMTYTVTAVGTPPLSYQWTKNGASLATQTTTSLALANLQTTDNGSYAVVITNLYGAVTSSVVTLTVAAKPVIVQQPQPMFTYIGGVAGFSATVQGSQPLSYQWSHGASQISGATLSSLGLSNVQLTDAGSYTCFITNIYGTTNSAPAVLTVNNQTNTDGYVIEILSTPNDGTPIAYYRLDETSGTIAHDVAGGHNGIYNSVALGQAGFSCIDSDPAAIFGPGPNSYVGSILGIDGFAATTDTTAFSLEAWVNGPTGQTSGAGIITKGTGNGGEQFNLDVYGGNYRFFVRDSAGAIPNGTITASVGPNGTWQHVVAVYDGPGGNYYLYINGQQVGAKAASAAGILSSTHEVSIGARQSTSGAYDDNFKGTIDEVAIYATALNGGQVYNHYIAQLTWPGFAPRICQQPQPLTVWPSTTTTPVNATFSVLPGGDNSFTYQWMVGGSPILNANSPSYTLYGVQETDANSYSCAVTNTYGGIVSAGALLTVIPTNSYTSAILNDGPISFWRLDETTGTTAHDYWGGNNGTYNNVTLNQPGYAVADTDPGIGLPANSASRGYVQVTNYTPFTFNGVSPFTFEGWVNFSNAPSGVERLFSTMRTGASPNGYGFGVSGASTLVFTTAGVADNFQPLTAPLVPGVWYYLVCANDGGNYNFYVNGQLAGSQPVTANTGVAVPLQLGANPSGWPYAEQVDGLLDEMAIYNYALSAAQVLAHYTNAPVPAVPVAQTPVITTGGTNYVGLSATFQENASGQALQYQWYKAPSTLLAGQTASTMTLSPLATTDAGSYYVHVSNGGGATNTPSAVLTVWTIPTDPIQLNLTNGLVLHLPFDTDYGDISGRGHNGTNVGATTFVAGEIGAGALSYSSTIGGPYNYVTLGVVPDLQFDTNDFSVSFWVQLPASSTYTNLPFFTDAEGSTGHGGFAFTPCVTPTGVPTGGWMWTIGSVTSDAYSPANYNTINDGNWHHLVHVAQRSGGNCTTYLDGVQVDSSAVVEAGSATTAYAATIGQDPTGAYPATAGAFLDDLGVWTNALTQLQVKGIYLAGATNHVSFAPVVVVAPPPASTTISGISGTTLSYTGGGGSQFVLLGTSSITTPLSGWTRLATNSASPGSFTIPAVGSSAPKFYRIKSE